MSKEVNFHPRGERSSWLTHLPGRDTNQRQHQAGKGSDTNQITWPGPVQRPDTSHGLDGDGPNLSPSKTGSRLAPVPAVDLSAGAEARQPRSGIRPAPRQGGSRCEPTTHHTHTTAASISTPEASSSTSSTTRGPRDSNAICPLHPTHSSTPSDPTARDWSSAASACSPGTGWPTSANASKSPSSSGTPWP